MGPIANLSSPFQLFLNPNRIQIQTQFFCGSHFLPLLAHQIHFSRFLSLSPLGHYRYGLLSPIISLQCHQPNKLLNPHRPMKKEVQQVLPVKTLQYPKPALRGTSVSHLEVLNQPPRVSETKAKRVMKSQQRLEAFSKNSKPQI